MDKTGIVIAVRQFDQYVVRVDGSDRVTVRNRKFLRQYTPVSSPPVRLTIEHDIESLKRVIQPPSHTQTATKDDVATYPTPSQATATNVPFTDDMLHDRRSTTPDAPCTSGRRHITFDVPKSLDHTTTPTSVPYTPTQTATPPRVVAPSTQTRRSTRQTRKPQWHGDYDTDNQLQQRACEYFAVNSF